MQHTIGQWIEYIIDKDDYIQSVVSQYTNKFDPSIRLSTVIDLLDEKEKDELKNKIDNYIKHGIKDKDIDVNANVETGIEADVDIKDIPSDTNEAGQHIFISFLKTLMALGCKNIEPRMENIPNEYIIYYKTNSMMTSTVRDIFYRYASMKYFFEKGIIKSEQDTKIKLCFGVRADAVLDYGFIQNGSYCRFGKFNLTDSVIKWLCFDIDVKSATSLKNMMLKMTPKKISLFGKIRKDMMIFGTGYIPTKTCIKMNKDVIEFGYYGIGKWNSSSEIDQMELLDMKKKFNDFVINKKWADDVLICVFVEDYWVYYKIKLK